MEEIVEGPEPQNTPEGTTPSVEESTVTLSKAELEALQHKAEVSSQNFERAKKAETKLRELESISFTEVPSDEDAGRVAKLESDMAEIRARDAKRDVIESNPILKEHWNDFESFRESEENKGMNLKTAAKAYLTEKGLLEPKRIGLEKPTGGTRAPVSVGMTAEEVKNLRETDFRKYTDMLMKGQIQVS